MATRLHRGPGQTHGFTLVEVLVALLIMSVIAAMGWQGVASMARARDHGAAATERTLRVAALVDQWEQDLQAVYNSPVVPGLQFDGASMRIARRSGGGVQIVVWALRSGQWQRWASPVTTRRTELAQAWLASQQLQGREPEQLLLLDGVTDWQVYFYRGQGWSNAQSSGDLVVDPVPQALPPPTGGADASGQPGAANPGADAGKKPETGGQADGSAAGGAGGAGTAEGTGSASGGGAAPAPQQAAPRTQLPSGVRLQIQLPEGRLTKDVLLAPQMP